MSAIHLIASTSYIVVNVTLAEKLGLNEALILGALCSGNLYCEAHDMINEDGFFPFSIELLQGRTTLKRTAQNNALDTLKGVGIVEQKNIGSPPQRCFRINEKILDDFLSSKCLPQTIQNVCHKQFKVFATNNSKCLPPTSSLYKEKYIKRNIEEEIEDVAEPTIDEQIELAIQAWNNNKNIKAHIDRIPFGTRRYDNMFLSIAQFGWDRFISEIRSIDGNKWFEEWQPTFDWIVDPNNFMKLMDGNYKEGKKNHNDSNDADKEWIERWLNDEE